jgi:putative flippase GtrA
MKSHPGPTFAAYRERLLANWWVRSLLAGAGGGLVDLCIVLIAARLIGFAPPLATACGLGCGATANFLLNRRFHDEPSRPVRGPALRFAAGTAVLIAIHACVVAALSRIEAPLLVAKYTADMTVLLGGNLLLVRFIVFRNPARSNRGRLL